MPVAGWGGCEGLVSIIGKTEKSGDVHILCSLMDFVILHVLPWFILKIPC